MSHHSRLCLGRKRDFYLPFSRSLAHDLAAEWERTSLFFDIQAGIQIYDR